MSSTSHQRLLQARRLLILQYSSRLRVRSIAFQWPSDSELLSIQPYLLKDLGVNQEEKEDQRVNLSTKPHQNRRANEEYDRMFFKALISRLEAAVKSQEMQGGNDEVVSIEEMEFSKLPSSHRILFPTDLSYLPKGSWRFDIRTLHFSLNFDFKWSGSELLSSSSSCTSTDLCHSFLSTVDESRPLKSGR